MTKKNKVFVLKKNFSLQREVTIQADLKSELHYISRKNKPLLNGYFEKVNQQSLQMLEIPWKTHQIYSR